MDWKLMERHYTHLLPPVKNLLENSANALEIPLGILSCDVGQTKTLTFGQYLKAVLKQSGMNPYAVEQASKAEAIRRGADPKLHTISDAKVSDILADAPSNHTMSKLKGLAWAIEKPVHEVVAHAFGFAEKVPDFQGSEVFRLWELQQQLKGEEAKYYAKRIQDLTDEIERKVRAAKRQGR